MAGEQIQVTPAVLRWAREQAGFSVDDLLPSFKKLDQWEADDPESFPTYPQLEQLADKFKVPVAVFFFPEPPDLPPIGNSFRTLPEAMFERIPPRIISMLRKAKAMQLNLAELNDGVNPADRLVTRDLTFRPNVPIDAMARRVREYLGVSLAQQSSWASDENALKNWRQVLLGVGLFVFKDAFRFKGYSGFCLYDDEFPIIYVNNSTSKTRQIFTLFHELAHLVFRTSGIDALDQRYRLEDFESLPAPARRIERICNQFAAQFLVPEDVFEATFSGLEPTEETAEALAKRFRVSRAVIFLRFLERDLIGDDTYDAAVKKWAGQTKGSDGGDFYKSQISYLGSRYIGLALGQYYQNRINEVQLADYLNITPKNLSTFEERFAASGA